MSAGRIPVGYPVDLVSGAMFTAGTDFRVPGWLELRWRHHYSTFATSDISSGPRWTVPYFMTLEPRSEGYMLSGAHGEDVTFAAPRGPLRLGAVLLNPGANMESRCNGWQFVVLPWHGPTRRRFTSATSWSE